MVMMVVVMLLVHMFVHGRMVDWFLFYVDAAL